MPYRTRSTSAFGDRRRSRFGNTARTRSLFSGVLTGISAEGEDDFHVFKDGRYIGKLTLNRRDRTWTAKALPTPDRDRTAVREFPGSMSGRMAALRWMRRQA